MTEERGTHVVVPLLVLLNVVVFIVQIAVLEQASMEQWMLTYDAVMVEQRYEVLLTSSVLHGSVLHLGMNMVFLYTLGRICEGAYGTFTTGLIYVSSVVAGGVAFIFLFPAEAAVGASGGVFGLVGAAMLGAPNRSLLDEIPVLNVFSLPLLRNLFAATFISTIFLVLPNLLNMFNLESGVAHIAHVGGLVAGAFWAVLLRSEHVMNGILQFAVFTGFAAAIVLVEDPVMTRYAVFGMLGFAVISPLLSRLL